MLRASKRNNKFPKTTCLWDAHRECLLQGPASLYLRVNSKPKTLAIRLGTPREPLIRWGHPTCIVVQITWKRGLKKNTEEKMRHRWIEWQFVTLLKPFSSHFPQSTSNVANSNKFLGPGLLLRPKWTLECQNQKAWRSSHISLHSKTRAAWRLCPEFHMWYSKAEITLKQAEINAKHIAYFISSWCRQPSHSKSDTVELCDSFANSRYHVACTSWPSLAASSAITKYLCLSITMFQLGKVEWTGVFDSLLVTLLNFLPIVILHKKTKGHITCRSTVR